MVDRPHNTQSIHISFVESRFNCPTPPEPFFEVLEWGLADEFDDFLTEKIELKYVTKTFEKKGGDVSMRFFPIPMLSIFEMREIVDKFYKQYSS